MTERPTPDLDDPRDPGLPRRQRLVLREGDPPRRRPRRRSRSSPPTRSPASPTTCSRCCPGCASTPARAAAAAASSSGSTRAPGSGHVAEHCRAGAAAGGRPRHPARQDPQVKGQPGRLQRRLRLRRRAGRAGRRPSSPYAWSTTSSRPTRSSTGTTELEAFILRAERTAFGPSTQAIVDEAVSRDIPWIRLNQHSLVQLGQGVHAKRIRATMTSETVVHRGRRRLRQGPHHQAARRGRACRCPSRTRCAPRTRRCAVAERIGYPVVVKPLDGNHGRGVCLDLQRRGRRARGVPDRRGAVAARLGDRRVVRHRQGLPLPGHRRPDRRDRRAGAGPRRSATARRPSSELVDLTNADPRRGVGHEKVLTRIKVDAAAEEVLAAPGPRPRLACRRRARWSSSPSPATCRPAASRSTAPSRRTPRTSRSPRRPPG